jgi:hypothetical protein
MMNSPKGVLGGGGDRGSECDGARLAPIFDDGGSSQWGLSGDKKQSYGSLGTSSSLSEASIAMSDGGRWWRTTMIRVRRVLSFVGNNLHHGVHYL